MASTFAVTRNHLIFGVCLPFAVLLGYLLADVRDPVSLVIIMAAIAGLTFPLLMRWYHPILIFSWNLTAQATFLPGAPLMWALCSCLGMFFAILNRSINAENKFAHVPSLTAPLLAFAVVIITTATMTGGFNLQILGSSGVGGKRYFYILTAIMGFFALSSRKISPKHAYAFAALFYLPGIAGMFTHLAANAGPAARLISFLFPGEIATDLADLAGQPQADGVGEVRLGGMMAVSFALFSWMLVRYGIRGVFDLGRPWRLGIFLIGIAVGFLGGFRSHLISVMLAFGILFVMERLWRTRVMLILIVMGFLSTVFLAAFANKLPSTIQRTISFLPFDIDPMIKVQADSSSQWRIDIWKQVVEEVPVYFFKGKGYTYSSDDMYMALYGQATLGAAGSAQGAVLAGDYHNGPLSLIIPFGIYGLLAFMWFVSAALVYLYKAYKRGLPELKTINAFLFASFLSKTIFFFSIFGAIATELYVYTGILGLSVALNMHKSAELEGDVEPSPAP